MTTREQAAVERGQAIGRSLGDRPSQRRSQRAPHGHTTPCSAQIRVAQPSDGPLSFQGFASVTEQSYEMYDMFGVYEEVVDLDAFDTTLAQPNLDVPLVLAHDALRVIARTTNGSLSLEAVKTGDMTGLRASAPNLDPADADVAYIVPKMQAGLVSEMSFRFSITRGQWSPDYLEYRIREVDINRGDVCICTYGANPYTDGAGLRDAPDYDAKGSDFLAANRIHTDNLALREAKADLVRF